MNAEFRVISSMATRLLLEESLAQYQAATGVEMRLESVGGVDAARRIREGEYFDIAVLASGAIQKLIDDEFIVAGSRVDLLRSEVAVAVPAGLPHPDIGSEEALRNAVLSAESIGYSTGPSGAALASLFERWGIDGQIAARIEIPPPGVPVGSLLAAGKLALGFQQFSELMNIDGIDVLGPLPDPVGIETVFSGGICSCSRNREAAARLLEFLRSDEIEDCRRRHGMQAV